MKEADNMRAFEDIRLYVQNAQRECDEARADERARIVVWLRSGPEYEVDNG